MNESRVFNLESIRLTNSFKLNEPERKSRIGDTLSKEKNLCHA